MIRCLALLFLLALARTAGAATELETVTLQLKWKHQFQFAGYYAAVEKGYYREAGLDVRLLEAEPGMDPVQRVLEGPAHYGVGTSELLLQRLQGKPIVVLGVIMQHSPQVLLVRRDAYTGFVQDLAGKAVMLEPQSAELLAYMKREGLDPARIRPVEHSLSVSALARGEVAAMSAYITDEPYELGLLGVPYAVFHPASAGIDFYGDNLFTTEGEIRLHPERVRAFREASLRGWAYAMEHPEEIARLIHDRYSQHFSLEHMRFEATQLRRLMRPDLVEPGHMHEGRWRHIAQTYRELGLVPSDISLDGFLYDQFVKEEAERLNTRAQYLGALLLVAGAALVHILRLHRRRRIGERQLASIIDTAPVALVISNGNLKVTTWNRQAEALFGWPAAMAIGRPLIGTLVPESRHGEAAEALTAVLKKGETVVTRGENLRRDAQPVSCEWRHAPFTSREGKPLVISMAIDITDRIRTERHLQELAHRDPLTGVANRAALKTDLALAIASAWGRQERFAVLYLDLDRFKEINDRHGHAAGDLTLKEVAQRLQSQVRESDTVSRLGGDEFVLLLPGVGDRAAAEGIAAKIREAVTRPISDGATRYQVGCSIGIALFPEDGNTAETLLHLADQDMYRSKRER